MSEQNSVKVEGGKTFIENEVMREVVGRYDELGANIIYDNITDTSRWSEHHECVFELDGKTFMTHYSRGATEMQDESPYEYDGEWIEVTEVVPKEVTVIKYVAKAGD